MVHYTSICKLTDDISRFICEQLIEKYLKLLSIFYFSTNGVFPRGNHGCSENDDMIKFAELLTDG